MRKGGDVVLYFLEHFFSFVTVCVLLLMGSLFEKKIILQFKAEMIH